MWVLYSFDEDATAECQTNHFAALYCLCVVATVHTGGAVGLPLVDPCTSS